MKKNFFRVEFNEKKWLSILFASFICFCVVVTLSTAPGPFSKEYNRSLISHSVDSPEDMANLLGDKCLYTVLDAEEYCDYSGSLSFDEGEKSNPKKWNTFIYSYNMQGHAMEGVVDSCSLMIFFPNYTGLINEIDRLQAVEVVVDGISAKYYLLNEEKHFNGEIGIREKVVFSYEENTYVLETTIKQDSGESIWDYFHLLF